MSEEKNHCLAHVIHVVVVQKIENAKQKKAIKYIVLTNIILTTLIINTYIVGIVN